MNDRGVTSVVIAVLAVLATWGFMRSGAAQPPDIKPQNTLALVSPNGKNTVVISAGDKESGIWIEGPSAGVLVVMDNTTGSIQLRSDNTNVQTVTARDLERVRGLVEH